MNLRDDTTSATNTGGLKSRWNLLRLCTLSCYAWIIVASTRSASDVTNNDESMPIQLGSNINGGQQLLTN